MGAGQHFRPAARIRRAGEFQRVLRMGARVEGRLMRIVALPQPGGVARLGLAVGRRLGGAVQRNRLKRWVRESHRRAHIETALDVLVFPKPAMLQGAAADVAAEYGGLLARLLRRARGRRTHEEPAAAAD